MAEDRTTNVAQPESISVLFVCLGNICAFVNPRITPTQTQRLLGRSPMAHAVFDHLIASLPESYPSIHTDSAGTGAYHVGSSPDPRTLATLQSHGITDFDHDARQVRSTDFQNFDYIFAMDSDNLDDLQRKCRRVKASDDFKGKISLFGDWDVLKKPGKGHGEDIEDPYYGGDAGFEDAFQQCVRYSRGWLRDVLKVDANMDKNGKVTIAKLVSE
jgi:low molecular weight phosphotyrosine protein phosphatase